MMIQTVLNKIENFKSFIFGAVRIEAIDGEGTLVIEILPRKNGKAECPVCGRKYGTYDTRKARYFEYLPLWTFKVSFRYGPSAELSDGWSFGGPLFHPKDRPLFLSIRRVAPLPGLSLSGEARFPAAGMFGTAGECFPLCFVWRRAQAFQNCFLPLPDLFRIEPILTTRLSQLVFI